METPAFRVIRSSLATANELRHRANELERAGKWLDARARHAEADRACKKGLRSAELILLLEEIARSARWAIESGGDEDPAYAARCLRRFRLALWVLGEEPGHLRKSLGGRWRAS